MTVTLKDMKPFPAAREFKPGNFVLASVNFRVAGIYFCGCSFGWNGKDFFVAAPKCVAGSHVQFESAELRAEMSEKAKAAYYLFGGTFQPPVAEKRLVFEAPAGYLENSRKNMNDDNWPEGSPTGKAIADRFISPKEVLEQHRAKQVEEIQPVEYITVPATFHVHERSTDGLLRTIGAIEETMEKAGL